MRVAHARPTESRVDSGFLGSAMTAGEHEKRSPKFCRSQTAYWFWTCDKTFADFGCSSFLNSLFQQDFSPTFPPNFLQIGEVPGGRARHAWCGGFRTLGLLRRLPRIQALVEVRTGNVWKVAKHDQASNFWRSRWCRDIEWFVLF